MPLIFDLHTDRYRLALWSIREETTTLETRCLPGEAEQARRFTSETRRREWLAWRALLQEMMPGAQVVYDKQGAPRLAGQESRFLSVSHTREMVAVMLADRPCGVDTEKTTRNFRTVATRYLSESEQRFIIPGDNRSLARMWCAKEAMYKWAGCEGLNLRNDICITAVDSPNWDGEDAEGLMTGSVGERETELHYTFRTDHCVVWCCG